MAEWFVEVTCGDVVPMHEVASYREALALLRALDDDADDSIDAIELLDFEGRVLIRVAAANETPDELSTVALRSGVYRWDAATGQHKLIASDAASAVALLNRSR